MALRWLKELVFIQLYVQANQNIADIECLTLITAYGVLSILILIIHFNTWIMRLSYYGHTERRVRRSCAKNIANLWLCDLSDNKLGDRMPVNKPCYSPARVAQALGHNFFCFH